MADNSNNSSTDNPTDNLTDNATDNSADNLSSNDLSSNDLSSFQDSSFQAISDSSACDSSACDSSNFDLSDDAVMAVINKVARRLAARFKFGYHEIQDIEQQARMIAWQGMAKYDGVRPLENYLWVHVHNRLFNFKRDNFFRPYGPCEKCSFFDSQRGQQHKCSKYEDILHCQSYQKWSVKNTTKLNLIYPIEFSCVDDYNEINMRDKTSTEKCVLNNELHAILNRHIPVEHRHNYLKMLYGYHVAASCRVEILELIKEIVQKYYLCETEEI